MLGYTARDSAVQHGGSFIDVLRPLGYVAHEDWAWSNYKHTIIALATDIKRQRGGGPVRLLEIGGGRDPLFSPAEANDLGLNITVNDIDASELAMAPDEFSRAHFDIAADLKSIAKSPNGYDVIFSRMVMEHIANVPQAWRNCHELLAPGGVALAFFPTLWAPPFLINYLVPDKLSGWVLRMFFPDRNEGEVPKFPALYDHCSSREAVLGNLFQNLGYHDHIILPFWNHGYFRAVPGAESLIVRYRTSQGKEIGVSYRRLPTRSRANDSSGLRS